MQKRFKWFAAGDGNNNTNNKKKLIFQHFGRALKGMPQRKWAKIIRNHHNYILTAFREKAQCFIWKICGNNTYE